MFTQPRIAPSILSADFMNMERDIRVIEEGGAGFVHVDVMDGHFVPNLTLGVPFVKQLKRITDLPLDVHLMISNPLNQLPWFLEHEPAIVSVHAEALDEPTGEFHRAIDMIHEAGAKACLALKPDMRASVVEPYIDKLDMVLVMSVYPGFSGQKYIEGTEKKVARVAEIARAANASPLIEVDGGLGANDATRAVAAAGADVFVAGNAVFGAADRAAAIAAMVKTAEEAQTVANTGA
ncbi:MAG: ribulose-phosphate 3-epimerase [Slackia sp.]|nr:ribulose-phosphate 3-epimerase [Slackia sp.]